MTTLTSKDKEIYFVLFTASALAVMMLIILGLFGWGIYAAIKYIPW